MRDVAWMCKDGTSTKLRQSSAGAGTISGKVMEQIPLEAVIWVHERE